MLAVGNSELYDSPHCYDQIELWRDFELRPAYLSEAKIVSAAKSKLLLHRTSLRQ
jgi:acyl-homoserine lactone acylase PvdQ